MTRPVLLGGAGLLTSAFYVAMFSGTGAHLPFWPLWFSDWGLSAAEIGFYGSFGMAARVAGGLIGPALADRFQARRAFLAWLSLALALTFAAHAVLDARAALFAATMVSMGLLSSIMPLGETLGLTAAKRHGFAYARARGIGSIGFLAANLAVGALIPVFGVRVVLWWVSGAFLLAGLLAFSHPGADQGATDNPPRLADLRRLFFDPVFVLFAFGVAILQGSHAVYYVFGSLHWRALGLSEGEIGVLWAISLVGEILFMIFLGPATVRKLGPIGTAVLAGLACCLRWLILMFDPAGPVLWFVQPLHALTFGAAHLGMMRFIELAVPHRLSATAQGMAAGPTGGIIMGAGMGFAALAYPAWQGRSYVLGLAFAIAGLVLCLVTSRVWNGKKLEI